jgi:hypothetical protein
MRGGRATFSTAAKSRVLCSVLFMNRVKLVVDYSAERKATLSPRLNDVQRARICMQPAQHACFQLLAGQALFVARLSRSLARIYKLLLQLKPCIIYRNDE